MFNSGKTADEIIKEKGFEQISDSSAIEKIVDEIIEKNQTQVEAYKNGNEKLFRLFRRANDESVKRQGESANRQ